MAHDYPWQADIDRDELHVRLHTVPLTNASAWRRTLIGGDTRRQGRGALSNTSSTLVFSS
jgi:hypothetical protein